MGFFEKLTGGISNHFERRRGEREKMEQLQKEVDIEARQVFEEQFKKNALEVAKAKAYQDASKLSGLQRLRAMNRAKRLNEGGSPPGSFFGKLSEYTQKNLAKREENLARTKMLREQAEKMRKEKLAERIRERNERMSNRKLPSWSK